MQHIDDGAMAFDRAFSELTSTWSNHQDLRMQPTPIPELAASAYRLEVARQGMRAWWTRYGTAAGAL